MNIYKNTLTPLYRLGVCWCIFFRHVDMTVAFAETDSSFARHMNPVRSKELAVDKLPNIVIELVEEEGLLGALSILLQPK
ncbi:hypothetical protein FOXYSP1_12565 [Fusarium oxysporum f. sp. phaseoli]